MKVALFEYELPPDLIAQTPAEPRDASRLMVLNRSSGRITHRVFREIVELFDPGDVLVLNDTRVIPARVYGKRATLGKVEALFLEQIEVGIWKALLGAKGRIRKGEELTLADGAIRVTVLEKDDEGVFTLRVDEPGDLAAALEARGHMPVPPYIKRNAGSNEYESLDRSRYQTVYASEGGAVAAPTAGLHFTAGLLESLAAKGVEIARVTLHVGLGTFRPVKVEDTEDHVMHDEFYRVGKDAAATLNSAARESRRVIAVGTTSARVLESLPEDHVKPVSGRTGIFIYPPYRFRRVDAMVTNFHLPGSTLLMMVSAFAGRERVLDAYREAVRERYRFYSYGDAMFIA